MRNGPVRQQGTHDNPQVPLAHPSGLGYTGKQKAPPTEKE